MLRFACLAVSLVIAIGCSKPKPKGTEPDKAGGDPKPAPGPIGDPKPATKTKPEKISAVELAQMKKVFEPLKGTVEYQDFGPNLIVSFSNLDTSKHTKIAPGTLKKLAPYANHLTHLAPGPTHLIRLESV